MPETPALPPGFVLDQPPPQGFVIDAGAPASITPETIVQDQMRLQQKAMDTAEQRGFQGVRDVAADVAPMVATGAGVAFGAPGGILGMMAGGAVGAAAGGRLEQLIRGAPEPSAGEKAGAAVSGAVAGLAGGVLQKGANLFLRNFQSVPDTKLSFDLQTKAKEIDKAFRAANPGAGEGKRGFASQAAKDLWSKSKVVESIEQAITRARGNPDRVREQFARIADNNRLMRRLTPEERALIDDVAQQSLPANILRSVGELRNLFSQGVGAGVVRAAAGPLGVGAAGRAVDRAATQRLTDAALAGVSGIAPPAAPTVPTGVAALGAGAMRPMIETEALIKALGGPR